MNTRPEDFVGAGSCRIAKLFWRKVRLHVSAHQSGVEQSARIEARPECFGESG
jgi:hypothetical protein